MRVVASVILLLIVSYVKANDTIKVYQCDTITLHNRINIQEVSNITLDGVLVFDKCRLILPEGSTFRISDTGRIVGSKNRRNKIKIGKEVIWKGNEEVMTTSRAISEGQKVTFFLMGLQAILISKGL